MAKFHIRCFPPTILSVRRLLVLVSAPVAVLGFSWHGSGGGYLSTGALLGTRLKSSSERKGSGETASNQRYNPMVSLWNDVTSSIRGAGSESVLAPQPQVDQALKQYFTPSWDEIRSLLESRMTTDKERSFRQNLPLGYGTASPLHKIRLYDESNREEDIRVTFYRDSASWCPYCHKVWMCLEEKCIPYRIEKINMRCYGDKPSSFLRLQPNGNIPVAVVDGKVYGQSNDIIFALEELFPEHKALLPAAQKVRAQELLRLERQIFSSWMYWLTGSRSNQQAFVDTLQLVEKALASSNGSFFMGKDVSLVDFMFAPFLERMAASLLYYKGFMMRTPPGATTAYPALNRWFDAMETLESYQLTKSDYYTHCWDLPPQLGGCQSEPEGEPYRLAIDGERAIGNDTDRGSWELPLQPHNGGVEPDWNWAGDESAARREAVERISANHQAIVRFAARGAGRKGVPSVMAPLSDPNAIPSDAVMGTVDDLMRTICLALLDGTPKYDAVMSEKARTVTEVGGQEFTNGVISSLAYVRDRVGVPRDMKLPAARQLRAHLNWSIGKLLETTS